MENIVKYVHIWFLSPRASNYGYYKSPPRKDNSNGIIDRLIEAFNSRPAGGYGNC